MLVNIQAKTEVSNSEFYAPLSILNIAKYTTNLSNYLYHNSNNNWLISPISESPTKEILWQKSSTNIDISPTFNENKYNDAFKSIENNIPWWSKEAPSVLRRLDFTLVDGLKDSYKINKEYQLTLVARQGAWGRVYLLQRLLANGKTQVVCAIKVLLNKTEKNKSIEEFRRRHKLEVKNSLIANDFDIAVPVYGIQKKTDDLYLLFLEYGKESRIQFKEQDLTKTINQIDEAIKEINLMHLSGFSHGDLTLNNMLYMENKIKLIDWFSLKHFTEIIVKDYRYDGDNLPPEAIRAFYFDSTNKDPLYYANVILNGKNKLYLLHPISADRFCLGMTLLEILTPDLYKKFEVALPKDFNPYKPMSLDFYDPYVKSISEIQQELKNRSKEAINTQLRKLLMQIAQFISIDPNERFQLP